MQSEAEFLAEINQDLPSGVDWKEGAREYLAETFRRKPPAEVERYLYSGPIALHAGFHVEDSLLVFADLMGNLLNLVNVLKLPPGSRILDVACGAGWVSHYLTKLGFETTGIDICADLLDYARRRMKADPWVWLEPEKIDGMFRLVDIELEPVPMEGYFDVAILESCFHHFHNPIAAMRHIAASLKPDGVVFLIEGLNRKGPIKPEYAQTMAEYRTIERPYPREQLNRILDMAGLPFREYCCPVNSWYSPSGPQTRALPQYVALYADVSNRAICAKSEAALQRVFPWWTAERGEVQYLDGFTDGEGGRMWSGPQSLLSFARDCEVVTIEVGSPLPAMEGEAQEVGIYADGRPAVRLLLTPEESTRRIELRDVRQGEQWHLCSSRLFCPAWSGETDRRLLSFWIAI